jgi:hypothetical protein
VAEVWSSFRFDPRQPQYASLRAADADRAVVSGVLADAYADGRLTAEEHEERESANQAAKTLGELPPLLADLVSPDAPRGVPAVPPSGDLHREAVRRYIGSLWEAGMGSATPFIICTVIWLFTNPGGYFWPVWVLFPVVLTVLGMGLNAPSLIRKEERDLEKKQRKALEAPRNPEDEQ